MPAADNTHAADGRHAADDAHAACQQEASKHRRAFTDVSHISAERLKQMLEHGPVTLVDVRSADERLLRATDVAAVRFLDRFDGRRRELGRRTRGRDCLLHAAAELGLESCKSRRKRSSYGRNGNEHH